jgi:hypothetical protein
MLRVDLHIVRVTREWRLQNANARTLAVFRDVEAAQAHAEATARQLGTRGLAVRLMVHPPGRRPQIFDFPALRMPAESYALSCCGLC